MNNCYIFPNFENWARCEKDLKDNKDDSLHLGRKYARIFVLGHYLFLAAHSFPRASLSEQIMSADKYPRIFSRQMVTIVYIVLVRKKYPDGSGRKKAGRGNGQSRAEKKAVGSLANV